MPLEEEMAVRFQPGHLPLERRTRLEPALDPELAQESRLALELRIELERELELSLAHRLALVLTRDRLQ